MAREAGHDEWNIQIKVNPTQVLDLLNHPVLINAKVMNNDCVKTIINCNYDLN